MKNFCLFLLIVCVKATEFDKKFYWREYTGAIPKDALPGGKDFEGFSTYIGQAYCHSHGIYVVQIYPGQKELDLTCQGVRKASNDIKILCTEDPENFVWIKTDNKNFFMNVSEQNTVEGGYSFVGTQGSLYIGRLMYQGVLKVGSILQNVQDAKLSFPHGTVEHKANFYQALVYAEPQLEIDARSDNKIIN